MFCPTAKAENFRSEDWTQERNSAVICPSGKTGSTAPIRDYRPAGEWPGYVMASFEHLAAAVRQSHPLKNTASPAPVS